MSDVTDLEQLAQRWRAIAYGIRTQPLRRPGAPLEEPGSLTESARLVKCAAELHEALHNFNQREPAYAALTERLEALRGPLTAAPGSAGRAWQAGFNKGLAEALALVAELDTP